MGRMQDLGFHCQKYIVSVHLRYSKFYGLWKKRKEVPGTPVELQLTHHLNMLFNTSMQIAIMSNFLGRCGRFNDLPMLLIVVLRVVLLVEHDFPDCT